jgi:phosphopentomutase
LLAYGPSLGSGNLGTRASFADIAATILDYFGIRDQQIAEQKIDGAPLPLRY